MIIDILTLFPEMFEGPFKHSIVKKAIDSKKVKINVHNLRDWATDKHKMTDDRPYGGGKGMVLMIEPIDNALNSLKKEGSHVILMSAGGVIFSQKKALSLSNIKHIIIICGHYEGVDQRVIDHLVDEEISIGKFVLTGGELPAMIVTDTIVRLIPGVLSPDATENESYSKENLLDYPQYTRPEKYKKWNVPPTLLSGNHKEINAWRKANTKKIK